MTTYWFRVHFIIEMIWWTGLAPWEFEFAFPGSLISTFLVLSLRHGCSLGLLFGAATPGAELKPQPEIRNPKPEARYPKPVTRNPKPETRNPKPETRNTKHETWNTKHET